MIHPISDIKFNDKKEVKEVKVKILNLTNEKIVNIKAYNFNPDSSFFRQVAIFFGSSRKVIPISIQGQKSPVYVKIQQMANVLNIDEKELRKQIPKKSMHNPQFINNLIKELYAVKLIKLAQPSEKLGDIRANLKNAITEKRARLAEEKKKSLHTIIDECCQEILDRLDQPLQGASKESNNKEIIKPSVKNSAKPPISHKSSSNKDMKVNNALKSPEDAELEAFLDFLGEEVIFNDNDETKRNLSTVGKRIGYDMMKSLISEEKGDISKQKIFQALFEIGKTIRLNPEQVASGYIRVKRDKKKDKYAFTVSKDVILIEFSTANKVNILGKGGSKIASRALEIRNKEGQGKENEIPQTEELARLRPRKKLGLQNAQYSITEELGQLDRFQGSKHVVHEFKHKVLSTTNKANGTPSFQKLVLYQRRYENGKTLLSQTLPLFHKLNAFIGIGKGIVEIHEKGYAHMDIKIDNCLLLGDTKSKTPIEGFVSDLGLSAKLGEGSVGGTAMFSPPESITESEKGYRVTGTATNEFDRFCFGMSILAALTGRMAPPIDGSDLPIGRIKNKADFDAKMKGYFDKIEAEWKNKNDPDNQIKIEMLEICNQLMQYDPKDRLSCEDAVKKLETLQSRYLNK